MPLTLAGLRIVRVEGDGAASGGEDVVWRVRRFPSLPPEPDAGGTIAVVREEPGPEGPVTRHVYGYGGEVRCRVTVSPDGSAVEFDVRDDVADRDLLGLFGETVLRVVLFRKRLTSFHAAALAKGGRSILLMGRQGAGKSTLSVALRREGWEPLADDVVRVDRIGGAWHAFGGMTPSKLLPDSAAALGHRPEALPTRWDDSGLAGHELWTEKRLLAGAAERPFSSGVVPLAAVFSLLPRHADGEQPFHRRATPVAAVRALVEQATPDPLGRRAMLPEPLQGSVGALVREVPMIELALPDSFAALPEAARVLDRLAPAACR